MANSPNVLVCTDDSVSDSDTGRSYRMSFRYMAPDGEPKTHAQVISAVNQYLQVSAARRDFAVTRIPRINDRHPQCPLAFCKSREVRPIPNFSRAGWEIDCEYETKYPVFDGYLTPLHEAPSVEYILEQEDYPADFGYGFSGGLIKADREPIVNTAGDKYIDDPVTNPTSNAVLTITKNYWDVSYNQNVPAYLQKKYNVETVDADTLSLFENSVTMLDDVVCGRAFKKRQALMLSVYPVNSYFIYHNVDNSEFHIVPYLSVQYKIKIKQKWNGDLGNPTVGSPDLYHEIIRRNTGLMALDDNEKKIAIYKNGSPVSQPVDLDLDGTVLPDDETPIYTPWLPYYIMDWSPLHLPLYSNVESEFPFHSDAGLREKV